MLNSGINFSFTIAMVTKVANKICLNREFSSAVCDCGISWSYLLVFIAFII